LLVTVRAPVAEEVDWGFWRDSARTLGSDHPTIAREAAPVHTGPINDAPVSGARFKEKRNAPSALDGARDTHRALLERMTAEIRRRKYSIRTEQGYESWVFRFILFCGDRDLTEVSADGIRAFLEDLAERGNVSASTQSQALNALGFLYKQVLGRSLDELGDFARAKRPKRLPVVLERSEVARLLTGMGGARSI
jgi:integrase